MGSPLYRYYLSEHRGDDLKSKYYIAYKENDHNHVKYLFFAYLESLKYF